MKKKALALAVYMAWAAPTIATAKTTNYSFTDLNLGEVKSQSNLGEPFKGIIPILFSGVEQARLLNIRLAPNSIFAKLGAEKTPELSFLHFRVKTHRKKPVIVVSSSRPIHSPILNFILEIESPKGITYQDYTVMLDPPKPKVNTKNKTGTSSSIKPQKTKVGSSHKSKKTKSRHYVKTGDTLSLIAMQYKHSDVSIKQMMFGIYHTNPNAFLNNDLNKIKKGALLRIPSSKKIRKLRKNHQGQINKANLRTNQSKNRASQRTNSQNNSSLHSYKVKRGDTLSTVTKKYRYKNVSFSKMMRAIFITNPDAFSKNRMNVLFTGVHLRIPTYTEVVNKPHSTSAKSSINTLSKPTQQAKLQKNSQSKIQAVFKSVLEKDSEKQTKKSLNTTKSRHQTLTKHNTKTSISAETANKELIQTLKNSNTTINNLQKRIRELRGNLSLISTDYQDLSEILSDKGFLQKITKNQGEKSIQTLINEYKNLRSLKTEPDTLVALKTKDKGSKVSNSGIINQYSNQFLRNKIAAAVNLTNEDYNYIILALLLGMVLIRYRESIYSYNSIPYDRPKFYPPVQETMSEVEKELVRINKNHTISQDDESNNNNDNKKDEVEVEVKLPEKKLIPETVTKEDQLAQDRPAEISKESLQECEVLIDELILELSKKTNEQQTSEQLDLKLNHIIDIEKKISPMDYSIGDVSPPFSEKHNDILINKLEKELRESTSITEKLWKDQEAVMKNHFDNSISTKAS